MEQELGGHITDIAEDEEWETAIEEDRELIVELHEQSLYDLRLNSTDRLDRIWKIVVHVSWWGLWVPLLLPTS